MACKWKYYNFPFTGIYNPSRPTPPVISGWDQNFLPVLGNVGPAVREETNYPEINPYSLGMTQDFSKNVYHMSLTSTDNTQSVQYYNSFQQTPPVLSSVGPLDRSQPILNVAKISHTGEWLWVASVIGATGILQPVIASQGDNIYVAFSIAGGGNDRYWTRNASTNTVVPGPQTSFDLIVVLKLSTQGEWSLVLTGIPGGGTNIQDVKLDLVILSNGKIGLGLTSKTEEVPIQFYTGAPDGSPDLEIISENPSVLGFFYVRYQNGSFEYNPDVDQMSVYSVLALAMNTDGADVAVLTKIDINPSEILYRTYPATGFGSIASQTVEALDGDIQYSNGRIYIAISKSDGSVVIYSHNISLGDLKIENIRPLNLDQSTNIFSVNLAPSPKGVYLTCSAFVSNENPLIAGELQVSNEINYPLYALFELNFVENELIWNRSFKILYYWIQDELSPARPILLRNSEYLYLTGIYYDQIQDKDLSFYNTDTELSFKGKNDLLTLGSTMFLARYRVN